MSDHAGSSEAETTGLDGSVEPVPTTPGPSRTDPALEAKCKFKEEWGGQKEAGYLEQTHVVCP